MRTQTDIELYQAWQAGNRQRNTEMLEYNKMREYYQAKGIDAPYSTLAAFRRARRAQSENYQESRKEWGEKPQEKPKKHLTNLSANAMIEESNTEVGIEVDIATPCLVNKQTGEIVKTEMKVVPQTYAKEIDKSGEYGFSWSKIIREHPKSNLAVLTLRGETRVEGVVAYEEVKSDNAYIVHNIEKPAHNRGTDGEYAGVAKHLFAYVSKIALNQGKDCIEFKAKSSLIKYYEDTLGAWNVYGQMMCLEKEQMQKLVDIYYSEGNDEKK